jgi:catechol 2,3-dioxygenase-like lactoylglutathione lyase family enzyme
MHNRPMIRGIKFASVPVADQDRALAFYTEKLGFRLQTDQPFDGKQRWLELAIPGAETRVVLFSFDEGPKPGSMMNVTFWTDPTTQPWGTFAIFKDADANTFVLSTK